MLAVFPEAANEPAIFGIQVGRFTSVQVSVSRLR